MQLSNEQILFSSMMGSKVAGAVPRFELVENELAKHVLPPVSILPIKGQKNTQKSKIPKAEQFFPFSFFGEDGKEYMLPYEPLINISSKNNIIRRRVAKTSTKSKIEGTIKEHWSRDDYEITITGALYGSILTGDVSQCFPRRDFEQLAKFMTTPQRLKINCEILQLLGINYIVVESFTFPFTKGENVQAYEIKAYSDFTHNLLFEIDN